MRRLGLALLAAALLALAGCGGDDGGGSGDRSATDLLKRGFATDVDTGEMSLEAEVELDGGGLIDGNLELSVEGLFRSTGGPTAWPDLDMEFEASGAGQNYSGRVISTRENAWVEYGGETYEVGAELWARLLEGLEQQSGPDTLAQAGVDPLEWVRDAETDGSEEVDGVQATKVTGRLDVEQALRDLNEVGPSSQQVPESALGAISDAIGDAEFEAWIGEDDLWRRLSFETDFTVPEEERASFGGVEGGKISVEIELSSPNEPVTIEGPPSARPIDELLRSLGVPPEALMGPGFAQPTPG